MHLILASQSPRRQELLKQAGFVFTVMPANIVEVPNPKLAIEKQVEELARQKAQAIVQNNIFSQDVLVLAADTAVILNKKFLGKPKDAEENKFFLKQLSGQTHTVITALCLWAVKTKKVILDHECSTVTFFPLKEEQIDRYVASGDGLDKAGGYGLQSMDEHFVKETLGPFDNIIGLPVALLCKILKENHWYINSV